MPEGRAAACSRRTGWGEDVWAGVTLEAGGSGSRLGLSYHRAKLSLQPLPTPLPTPPPTPPQPTSSAATQPTANAREMSRRKSSERHRERTFRTIETNIFPAARADTDSVSAILEKGDETHGECIGT